MARDGPKTAIYHLQILLISLCVSQAHAGPQFTFCVINFEPIKILTCLAPQNYRLNLSFLKDVHIVGQKMARNCLRTATIE